MSNVKFGALGGLGENGKNMYLVEIDEKIFILDGGLKYPSVELLGIDTVLPNISYLIENKDRVQGVFLTHGHDDQVGAIPELLKSLDVGVFGTHFTMCILEDLLTEAQMDISKYRLYRINEEKELKFGSVKVSFFNVSHSIPECVGVSIKSQDGSIVYMPNFNFDAHQDKRYRTSMNKIADIGSEPVLALCSGSLGVNNINRVHNDYLLLHTITEILQSSKRVIVSCFSSDLDRIQKVINISIDNNRRVAIIGRKVQKHINIAMNNDYLKIPQDKLINLKFIDDKNQNNYEDLVVIVTGIRHEPFHMLQRMCRGQDKLIKINQDDSVVIMNPPVPGTEKMAARTIDLLNINSKKVTVIKRKILRSSQADSEDLKLLYGMLNPKYIIPVVGEYRHQYVQKNIAIEAGFAEEKILLLENGELITFINGALSSKKEQISAGDVLIDGSIIGDINEVVIKDRELLSQNGSIIVAIAIDSINKEISSEPEIISRGFAVDTEALFQELTSLIIKRLKTNLRKNQIDVKFLTNLLRDEISQKIYSATKKRPIVIPVLTII